MHIVIAVIIMSISMIIGGMAGSVQGYRKGQIDAQKNNVIYQVQNDGVYIKENSIINIPE